MDAVGPKASLISRVDCNIYDKKYHEADGDYPLDVSGLSLQGWRRAKESTRALEVLEKFWDQLILVMM